MAKGDYTVQKTITNVERVGMSKYGNPIHLVHFDDATTTRTEVDGGVNYMITNSDVRDVPVEVTFSRAGRVRHVKVVENTWYDQGYRDGAKSYRRTLENPTDRNPAYVRGWREGVNSNPTLS